MSPTTTTTTTKPRFHPANDSDLLSTEQVSKWIGVPAGTLRNWRSRDSDPPASP